MDMRIIISIICLVCSLTSIAQIDIESRIKRRVNCQDVGYFAFENIPKYYEKQQIDSIQIVMDLWSKKCPYSQVLTATQHLLEIQNGTANDINERLLSDLIDFIDSRYYRTHYSNQVITSRFDPSYPREDDLIYDNYIHFLIEWAGQLLKSSHDQCSDQYGILLCYSDNSDEFFRWLDNGCEQSEISRIYKNQVDHYNAMPDNDGGFFIEYWKPYSNLGILGAHPGIGGYIGSSRKWGFYRGTMAIRFLPSANSYFAQDRGVVEETDHFVGGYFMVHTGVKVLSFGSFHNYLVGGLGIDIMDVLKSTPDDPGSGKSIASFNPTIGWTTRVKFLKSNYIAIEAEYNFLNYVNTGGTDLSGSALSLKLLFGWLWNYNKDYNLRLLRQ